MLFIYSESGLALCCFNIAKSDGQEGSACNLFSYVFMQQLFGDYYESLLADSGDFLILRRQSLMSIAAATCLQCCFWLSSCRQRQR